MKKQISLLLSIFLIIVSFNNFNAQTIIKIDDCTYSTDDYASIIVKNCSDNSDKIVNIETNIPDKSNKEVFYSGANNTSLELLDNNILIIYDVWSKKTKTKDCYLKFIDVTNDKVSTSKLLHSTSLNSIYSSSEIIYTAFYSPNKSMVAILKDNTSFGYPDIHPEIIIYDTKTFDVLSSVKTAQKHEGKKRVFDVKNFSIDNEGNIFLAFHTLNEETKMPIKTFTAEIPFNETNLNSITEYDESKSNGFGGDKNTHGRIFKTLDDLLNNNPVQGIRVKNGSFSWSTFGGSDFELIDDLGNIIKSDAKKLPGEVFTYKSNSDQEPWIMRIIDEKPYIVLAMGQLNYYSLFSEQQKTFYSEGWNGEMKSFVGKEFEAYLAKYGLLEEYEKNKPKREFEDSVNDYFNKQISYLVKYFNLLNEKM